MGTTSPLAAGSPLPCSRPGAPAALLVGTRYRADAQNTRNHKATLRPQTVGAFEVDRSLRSATTRPEEEREAEHMATSDAPPEDPIIEDLAPTTITAVADRIETSKSFTEMISRECELDALWTLCDVALDYTSSSAGDGVGGLGGLGELHSEDRANLEQVRTVIGEAITVLGAAQNAEASVLLRQAAVLAESLP